MVGRYQADLQGEPGYLYYLYHKLLPPPGGCFGLLSACYFPFLLYCSSFTLFRSSGVFGFFFFFSTSFFFKCWRATSSAGGRHDRLFLLVFAFISFFFFFYFSFDLSTSFLFSL